MSRQMIRPEPRPDGRLEDWAELRKSENWSGLLIGNGASQAVWPPFGYTSLYETAASNEVDEPLTEADVELFDRYETHNFEQVLGALAIAKSVNEILRENEAARSVSERFDSIRRALVSAVHAKHVEHSLVGEDRLHSIGDEISKYGYVFSTNYDLLVYWSMMQIGVAEFRDYFWASNQRFDLANTEVWNHKITKVFFIHGGLHLCRTAEGGTVKMRRGMWGRLLDNFGDAPDGYPDAVPLFVAEGDSSDKLSAIYRSDYLSFAYSKLLSHSGSLVIFGHSLSNSDKHIIDAIDKSPVRRLAVSVRPDEDSHEIAKRKLEVMALFPHKDVIFYDSQTHPLGAETLRVQEVV